MHAGAVLLQISGMFELLLAYVARMPLDIDVVHIGAVLLQSSGLFELLLAHVARMPLDIDVLPTCPTLACLPRCM